MLPRRNRIQKKYFPESSRGKVFFDETVRISIRFDNRLVYPKCAVIISKKISKTAIIRNRVRRQWYAVLQKNISLLPCAFITISPKKTSLKTCDLEKTLKKLISL